jgi:hypothetical protein
MRRVRNRHKGLSPRRDTERSTRAERAVNKTARATETAGSKRERGREGERERGREGERERN